MSESEAALSRALDDHDSVTNHAAKEGAALRLGHAAAKHLPVLLAEVERLREALAASCDEYRRDLNGCPADAEIERLREVASADALIAASSLGTPEAAAVRAKTAPDVAQRIVARSVEIERDELRAEVARLREVADSLVILRDRLEDEAAETDEAWKNASGLCVNGDPDGVTPEILSRFIREANAAIELAFGQCATNSEPWAHLNAFREEWRDE